MNTIDETFKDSLYRETRKIEAYNADIEIDHQLVNDPMLESDVFAESIRNDRFNKEYIAKTLLNTISKKEKELNKQHQEDLKRKDADIQQEKNDKKKQSDWYCEQLNKQKIDAQRNNIESLETYKETQITRKIEALRKKLIIKIQLFFKRFNKSFDENEFLRKKACTILEIDFSD
ncbi:MAG: hypothetical protein J6K96_06870 [Treponema sp.]|nr:hypothetical protein [Treponema sp.]